jgi:hypothetical protein
MSARSKIDRKAEAVIAALLTEPSHAAAAAKAGVGEATVQRWLRDPVFLATYRAARRMVIESAVGRLQQATEKAVATLERNLACGQAGSEIRAATAIIDAAIRGVDQLDVVYRVEVLEAQAVQAADIAKAQTQQE